MIKTVNKGEAIKATWANSIVNTVNAMGGIDYYSRSIGYSTGKGFQYASNAAFQVRYTKNGEFSINAGQVYVDGILIKPTNENELEEASYNMFGSLENWSKVCLYSPTSPEDFPLWQITIYKIDSIEPDSKKPLYRAALQVQSSNESQIIEPYPTPNGYSIWHTIPINTVDNTHSEIKQLISGTIYLTTEDKEISLIAKDGIIIDYSTSSDPTKPDVYQIGLDPSFIPHSDLSIVAGDNIIVDYSYQNNVTTYTISAKYVSIIGKDGIKVNEIDKNVFEISLESSPIIGSDLSIIGKDGVKVNYPDSKTVEVSLDPSFIPHSDLSIIGGDGVKITEIDQNTIKISFDVSPIIASDIEVRGGVDIYVEPHTEGTTRVFTVNALSKINLDFDTNWFKINNGIVTFNEEKLIQLAEQIANNTTVNLQVTGIVDTVKNGSVQVNTTGLIDGEATTNVTIV